MIYHLAFGPDPDLANDLSLSFGPMENTATCITPGIKDFGHWFWKIGRDAHNLQLFNGLISKKKKKRKSGGHFPSEHNYVAD